MPEFYDMYSDTGLEIYEGDTTSDYAAVGSFMVDDEDLDSPVLPGESRYRHQRPARRLVHGHGIR